MIKFKEIMQKAASQFGHGGGTMRLLARPDAVGAVAAGAGAEEAGRKGPWQDSAGDQAVPADATAGEAEGLVTDELVADVLGAMFPGAKGTEEGAKEEAGAEALVEEAVERAEGGTGEAEAGGAEEAGGIEDADIEGLMGGEEQAGFQADDMASAFEGAPGEQAASVNTEKAIEDMISDAFAAATEQQQKTDEKAGGEVQAAQDQSKGELEETGGPPGEAVGAEAEEAESSKSIDSSFMAEVDRLLSEFGTFDVLEEKNAAAEPFEIPAEFTASREEEPAPPEAVDTEASGAATKDEPRRARDAAEGKESVKDRAEPARAAKEKASKGRSAAQAEQGLAGTLSQEEKDALFAEESAFELDELGQQVVEEVEGAAEAAATATGKTAEVELDFTAGAVGLESPGEETPVRDEGEELLSKVLADLDKLGSVEKPQREVESEEPESQQNGLEDFSQILSELNSQAPEPPESPAETASAKAPEAHVDAVEVKADSLSEEEIIGDALKAGDEEPPADVLDELKEAEEKGPEEGSENEDDEDDSDGEGGAKTEVQDEAALLANLTASMDAAEKSKKAEGESGEAGDDEFADEEQQNENEIRREVLNRTKEVEQKVLDDVFGENTKDYKAELKAEMNSLEAAQGGSAEKVSALAAESARLAAGHAGAAGAPAAAELVDRWAGQMTWLIWVACQINRPFRRWLSPARLRLLGAVCLALLSSAMVWLAAALARLFWPA